MRSRSAAWTRDHRLFDRLSSSGEPRRRRSEMTDVCDRVGNCGTDPEFSLAEPLIVAEHIININNPTRRRDVIFGTAGHCRQYEPVRSLGAPCSTPSY
jgi:hypothetical protein